MIPNTARSFPTEFIEVLDAAPDLCALHATCPERYPHLLESVAQGAQGRFDILFAFPGLSIELASDGVLYRDQQRLNQNIFLQALDETWRSEQGLNFSASELPFTGGWFIFLAYELIEQVEPIISGLAIDNTLPRALATRFQTAIIRDHIAQKTFIVYEPDVSRETIDQIKNDVYRLPESFSNVAIQIESVIEDDSNDYIAQIHQIKEYIASGDVFQVNLSRGWQAMLKEPLDTVSLYRYLRLTNPGPFAGIMTLPNGNAIVSSSPERLVQVRGRSVCTRPIAGTYPRGKGPAQDNVFAHELLAHPKERAEHIMLIDLERNDLGRICRPGTIRMKELMALETYQHVHHIVSEIEGELGVTVTPGDVIRAVFPGGTITGCPKVRCMQIIAELEQGPRGAYTGAMGYLNRSGDMDLNILIRTIVQRKDRLDFRAGAGIVADSLPEREVEETRAKARGLLAALGLE